MKGRYAAALVVLLAGCHFDKLFSGGGGQLSHGTPVALVFNAEPSSGAHAGEALTPPIRVAIVDSAGTPVAGADSLITIELGSALKTRATGVPWDNCPPPPLNSLSKWQPASRTTSAAAYRPFISYDERCKPRTPRACREASSLRHETAEWRQQVWGRHGREMRRPTGSGERGAVPSVAAE